jgi:hypothetical protein
MAKHSATVGEFSNPEAFTAEQVNATTDAYLTDRTTGAYPIADDDSLALAAAVNARRWTTEVMGSPTRRRR